MAGQETSPDKNEDLLKGSYTEAEKKEILSTIDHVISGNRIGGQSGKLIQFPAKKKGILFPLVVNLLAVLLVVGGWFVADWFFRGREAVLKEKTNQIFSTEGRLLAKLMEESKAQLDAKNKELQKIQGDLSSLEDEKNQLEKDFAGKLSAKESELQNNLNQMLDAERLRLKKQGVSEGDIVARMKAFESQKAQESQKILDEFRQESQSQIAARNKELEGLKDRLQTLAVDQEKLKTDLESQAKERESTLKTQLNQQSASLEKLAREQEDLILFNRQADKILENFQVKMESFQYAPALDSLENLSALSEAGINSTSEVVQHRAQANKALSVSLAKAVRELRSQSEKVGADPQYENFKVLASKAALVKDPGARYEAFNLAAEGIPEVKSVYQNLKAYDEERLATGFTEKLSKAEQQIAALKESAVKESDLAAAQELKNQLESVKKQNEELQVTLRGQTEELAVQQKALADLTAAQASVKALADLKSQLETLSLAYKAGKDLIPGLLAAPTESALSQAENSFVKAFESPAGQAFFPGFAEVYQTLRGAQGTLADQKLTAAGLTASASDRDAMQKAAAAEAEKQAAQQLLAIRQELETLRADKVAAEKRAAESDLAVKNSEEKLAAMIKKKAADDALAVVKPTAVIDPKPYRDQAFGEVLTFTNYLAGDAEKAKSAREKSEALAKTDPRFKEVADAIQVLARSGARESLIKTGKLSLLGPLITASGNKVIAESLTNIKAEEGFNAEVRRTTSKGELVLARGTIKSVSGKRIELELGSFTDNAKKPLSGDVVYLEVR